jgi:hypothetical protein
MANKTRHHVWVAVVSAAALGVGAVAALGTGVASADVAAASSVPKAASVSAGATNAEVIGAEGVSGDKKKLVKSNVSEMRDLGVIIGEPVLIDVTDDGLNRYLAVGKKGRVNFTGKRRNTNTQMTLMPAYAAKPAKNRVTIMPDWYNEDLGPAQCVTDVRKGVLQLRDCKKGAANQRFKLVPFGDAGAFEMSGKHTHIMVDNGKITSKNGYVGLQTIDFVR